MKYLICDHCGNLVEMLHDCGVQVYCCGSPMEELNANVSEGAQEKHLPIVREEDGVLVVELGQTAHPMEKEHLMEWVAIETEHGGQRRMLRPGDDTTLRFPICEQDRPKAVYAYCNLHGLWMAPVP